MHVKYLQINVFKNVNRGGGHVCIQNDLQFALQK